MMTLKVTQLLKTSDDKQPLQVRSSDAKTAARIEEMIRKIFPNATLTVPAKEPEREQ